ncbi:MAG: hypothetical protein A2237_01545 [Stygiobacter sp. RIFOXYA2_FULL_38_8]|nr:MAG: hypothetical protein A2237_01545 [Stygiobacter sp. RIFOXYA2_FULL_38_8]
MALAIVAVSAGALSVYANGQGEFNKKMNFNPEQRAEFQANLEAMKTAMANNDYQAWQELNQDSKMAEVIDSQAKFDQMIRMYNLMKEGKFEEASQIAEELGLPMGHHAMGMDRGFGPGFKVRTSSNIPNSKTIMRDKEIRSRLRLLFKPEMFACGKKYSTTINVIIKLKNIPTPPRRGVGVL